MSVLSPSFGKNWCITCTWLTEGKTAHLLPRGKRRDPLLLLLFRAKFQDGSDVQRLRGRMTSESLRQHNMTSVLFSRASVSRVCAHIVYRYDYSRAGAASADLLYSQGVRQVIHPGSAQLLWHLHRHHPHRPQLMDLDSWNQTWVDLSFVPLEVPYFTLHVF